MVARVTRPAMAEPGQAPEGQRRQAPPEIKAAGGGGGGGAVGGSTSPTAAASPNLSVKAPEPSPLPAADGSPLAGQPDYIKPRGAPWPPGVLCRIRLRVPLPLTQ